MWLVQAPPPAPVSVFLPQPPVCWPNRHVPPCPAMGLFWEHALSFSDSPPTPPSPHPVPPFARGLRKQGGGGGGGPSLAPPPFLAYFPGCWTLLGLSMLLPGSFRTFGLMPSLRGFLQLLKTFLSLYSSRNDSFFIFIPIFYFLYLCSSIIGSVT